MHMSDHPEQLDDVDVLLRKHAAERRTFAANTPDLHEVDIRRLAAEACKEWHKEAPATASLWDQLRGVFASFAAPQWSAVAVTAMILLFFSLWLPFRKGGGDDRNMTTGEPGNHGTPVKPPVSGNQMFAMIATGFRGAENPLQESYSQFDLDLNLASNEVTLKFSEGTTLRGNLLADDDGNLHAGDPMSYSINASGTDLQKLPIAFKGVLVVARDAASPNRAKEVSLRGILTSNNQEIQISAGMQNP